MKRPIKFRAWDKKQLVMVTSFTLPHLLNNYNSEYAPTQREDLSKFNFYGRSLYEVMQFTGLSDKNGKEIYEGDILLDSNWGMQNEGVFFNVDHGAFYSWWKYANPTGEQRKDVFSGGYFGSAKASTSEVIGNIYENPSLITSKETKEN